MSQAAPKKISEPILDQRRFSHLMSLGKTKPELLPQVVDAFVKGSLEILQALKDSPHNPEKVHLLGSQLKNMSENIGAVKLEKIADEIEKMARSGKRASLSPLIQAADEAFQSTRDILQGLL